MMKSLIYRTLLCLLGAGSFVPLLAQLTDTKYYRRSVTYLMVANHLPSQYQSQAREAWSNSNGYVPNRMDANDIETQFLTVNGGSLSDSIVQEALVSNRITNELVAFWWKRQADGSFSTDRVAQRGLGTASVSDMEVAGSDLRGLSAVKDDGEKLLDKSLIVVYDYQGIQTYRDYYDEIDARRREQARKSKGKISFEPVERSYRGYRGKVNVRIYHLKFLGLPATEFYNDMWVDPSTDEETRQARMAKFDAYPFPVELIQSRSFSISGREQIETESTAGTVSALVKALDGQVGPMSMDQLFALFIKNGRSQANGLLIENTAVISTLVSAKPPQINIGTREDLHLDSRYFVYELKLKSNGDTVMQRKGVIRAEKVTDNQLRDGRVRTDLSPSQFYVITGPRLDAGMVVKENRDRGIFITGFGVLLGDVRGGGARIDYMVSQLSTTGRTGWFLGAFFGSHSPDVSEDYTFGGDLTFTRFGLGVRKSHYLMSHVRVGLGLDAGVASLTDGDIEDPDDEGFDDVAGGFLVAPNAEIGIHVWHNVQVVSAVRGFLFAVSNGESYRGGLNGELIYRERNNLSIDIGLRFNL